MGVVRWYLSVSEWLYRCRGRWRGCQARCWGVWLIDHDRTRYARSSAICSPNRRQAGNSRASIANNTRTTLCPTSACANWLDDLVFRHRYPDYHPGIFILRGPLCFLFAPVLGYGFDGSRESALGGFVSRGAGSNSQIDSLISSGWTAFVLAGSATLG